MVMLHLKSCPADCFVVFWMINLRYNKDLYGIDSLRFLLLNTTNYLSVFLQGKQQFVQYSFPYLQYNYVIRQQDKRICETRSRF